MAFLLNVALQCCCRIMNPVDGTEVYQDAETKDRCKQLWQQILKVMDFIGFKPDVSSLVYSVDTKRVPIHSML